MIDCSAIIPVFNDERTIKQAVNSALAQIGAGHFEVIVVDDGSTDATPDILARYGGAIRLIRQANTGVSSAINRGVSVAQGCYVAFLHGDDYWLPNKLAATGAAFKANPDAGVVFFDCALIAEEDDSAMGSMLFGGAPSLAEMLETPERMAPPSAVAMRRAMFVACGGFDERVRCFEDLELWLRARQRTTFAHVPRVLAVHRKRTRLDGEYQRYSASERRTFERIVFQQFGRRCAPVVNYLREQRAAAMLTRALVELKSGHRVKALGVLSELLCYRPAYLSRYLRPVTLLKLGRLLQLSI